MYGGEGGNVSNNSINITSGNLGGEYFYELAGGKGSTAQGNDVTISGGYISVQGIYGGLAYSDEASNNRVTITGGTVYGPVYGGKGSKSAYNNTVTISGGTIKPYTYFDSGRIVNVYGGFSDSAASAINNTVRLSGAPDLSVVSLYGGNDESRTGNTLEVRTVGLTAANVYNFEKYHFILPGSIKAGNTVLTLTDTAGTDISGAEVGVAVAGGSAPLKVGDSVTLLKNKSGLISEGYTQTTLTGTQGVSLAYDFTLTGTSTELIATVGTISEEPGGGDQPGGDSPVHVLPQTKALAEGYLAGFLLIRQGGDLIADRGMAYAVRAARGTGEYTFAPFGTISGGWSRYDTGAHIDVSSFHLLAGLARGADLAPGRFTAGLFFEYGNGSYDTSNSFSNAATVKGDGDAWYAGGGLLARMDFAETGPGHFYAEASARLGVLNNDYDNDDMRDAFGRRASYDSDSAYYGLHVGAGYVWNFGDKADLDLYARYLWTHQDSDSLHLSTGERMHFDSVDSHRLRLGARLACNANEYVRPYIGAAWEYEFDGKAEATTNGFDIDRPDLKGSTGMGELGITLTPSSTIPVSLDLGVQGYVGRREGVSGTLQLQWKF